MQAYAQKLRGSPKGLKIAAKGRARKAGLAFNLEESDITVPKVCPILGILLAVEPGRTGNTPSLDRMDNAKGYVKGNIAVISDRANSLKRDGTAEEHEKIAAWMRSKGLS